MARHSIAWLHFQFILFSHTSAEAAQKLYELDKHVLNKIVNVDTNLLGSFFAETELQSATKVVKTSGTAQRVSKLAPKLLAELVYIDTDVVEKIVQLNAQPKIRKGLADIDIGLLRTFLRESRVQSATRIVIACRAAEKVAELGTSLLPQLLKIDSSLLNDFLKDVELQKAVVVVRDSGVARELSAETARWLKSLFDLDKALLVHIMYPLFQDVSMHLLEAGAGKFWT